LSCLLIRAHGGLSIDLHGKRFARPHTEVKITFTAEVLDFLYLGGETASGNKRDMLRPDTESHFIARRRHARLHWHVKRSRAA